MGLTTEQMIRTNLPEPLPTPNSWKYTKTWKEGLEEKHGLDYLSQICKHSGAGFQIMYYICHYGEVALTKVKTQNLFIKRIAAKTVNPTEVRDIDIDWQSGSTWVRLQETWDELFEIYNAHMAPPDILIVLNEVKAYIDDGQSHCGKLLQYIAAARLDLEQKKEREREQELQQQKELQQALTRKWDLIDQEHSRVTEGFIYLLSNPLMPGVYKIGFTAGNPDKRAREVSMRYGLPRPFELIEYWRTKDPYIVEQRIHAVLWHCVKGGEFFEVDLDAAKQTIEACLK